LSAPIHFAVVAAVNRGKSSVVSTLAENDSIRIAPTPGTTRETHIYAVKVEGEILFQLSDTPGFERAREALAWIEQARAEGVPPVKAVRRFVDTHRTDPEYRPECELLRPILDGAAVLYVVDGSVPFRAHMRAEMEILRWASTLRVALINQDGPPAQLEAWRRELQAHFQMVRVFDAQRVGFAERIALLRGLREVNDDAWRSALGRAIEALELDWERRRRRAARIVAGLVAECVTHVIEWPLPKGESAGEHQTRLTRQFHDDLRRLEQKAREQVAALYRHQGLEAPESGLRRPTWEEDLFARARWQALGLTPRQLVAAGAMMGAIAGGGIDVAVGGASFMLGAMIGAAIGAGGAALHAGQAFASVESIRGFLRGELLLRIGPHRNPNFPFVVLDAAWLHWRAVRDRAHAKRTPLALQPAAGKSGPAAALDGARRRALARSFSALRRQAPRSRGAARDHLEELLQELFAEECEQTERAARTG
jgi:hypothetical protein